MTTLKGFLRTMLACLALAVLCGACSTRQETVVLLPDPDGKVGRVEVAASQGSQVLDRAGMAVDVDKAGKPGDAFAMDAKTLNERFGAAIKAAPERPARFLLYFESGGTDLTEASRRLLSEILATARARGSMDISIVGHSDRTGSTEYNMRLSTERAQAVARLLGQGGLDQSRFQVTSHGEANPLVPTPDNVAEPRNRRVEVIVR